MRKFLLSLLWLCGCSSVSAPEDFVYKTIKTRDFEIAAWVKTTDAQKGYKIYVEGDGYAFDAEGKPTLDPTPKGTLVRELAFCDENENVAYLSRPCQYVKSPVCNKRHWTTARFAPEIVTAEYEAVKNIAGNSPVILVGFSGGAQVAGLIATAKPGINVKKIITIAGNLDHLAWTNYHRLPPLNESMNLESYREQFAQIPQIHYVGTDDRIVPPVLVREFVGKGQTVVEINGAGHNYGWEEIYSAVRKEK